MTPPTASAAARSRRASAQRRSAVRRRRAVFVLGVLVLIGIGLIVALPTVKKAYQEFTLPLQHEDIIRQQAADKHLDPALIAGVIYAETKFDPRPSAAGAQGLMQILPETAKFLARKSGATTFTTADLATPQVNIAYGSYYLRYLLDEYGGKLVPAVAAYNGGEANVSRWIAHARAHGHALRVSDIPFPETRAYVERVLQAQRDYRHTYARQLGYQ
jgi:soluble lytic murein transglycosylase